jgi:hypothetical protein
LIDLLIGGYRAAPMMVTTSLPTCSKAIVPERKLNTAAAVAQSGDHTRQSGGALARFGTPDEAGNSERGRANNNLRPSAGRREDR